MPEWCLSVIYSTPKAQAPIALAPMVDIIATNAACDGDEVG
jgi:hypothetical protein